MSQRSRANEWRRGFAVACERHVNGAAGLRPPIVREVIFDASLASAAMQRLRDWLCAGVTAR